MAKKRPGRPRAEVETEAVRLRKDLVEMARWIALSRKVTIGQVLSDMVEPHIRREYDAVSKPKR